MQVSWTKVNACERVETILIHLMLHLHFIHPHRLFPCGELQGKFFFPRSPSESHIKGFNISESHIKGFNILLFGGDSVISLLLLLTTPMAILCPR